MHANASLPSTETAIPVDINIASVLRDAAITNHYTRDLLLGPAATTILMYATLDAVHSVTGAFQYAAMLACGGAVAYNITKRAAAACRRVGVALGQSPEQMAALDRSLGRFMQARGTVFGTFNSGIGLLGCGIVDMARQEIAQPGTYIHPGLTSVATEFIAPTIIAGVMASFIVKAAINHTAFVKKIVAETIGPIDLDAFAKRPPRNVTPRPALLTAEK